MPGPHDLLARFTFGHPERAAAELRAVLPPKLAARVDWSSVRQESTSVVDPELRETQGDLLFSARLLGGAPLLFYFLIEHQSSVERWMALRMLHYVLRLWEHWRQQNPDSTQLPLVIPLVLYHGPQGTWTAPRRVEELCALPPEEQEAWRVWVPRFEYLVDDLTAERLEALEARAVPPLVRLTYRALLDGMSEGLAGRLPEWKRLMAEVYADAGGLEGLKAVVNYLVKVGEKGARGALKQVLHSVAQERGKEDLMTTMVEAWIEEGMEKGMAQGRAKGKAEAVLQILAARGIAVDEQARQSILSCTDLVRLDRWLNRSLSATSLAEVLKDT